MTSPILRRTKVGDGLRDTKVRRRSAEQAMCFKFGDFGWQG